MKTARRRDTDIILVWRLDCWGRSVADLAVTIKELNELGVAFVSLTEALDLTTATGRAMAVYYLFLPSSNGRCCVSESVRDCSG